MIDDKNRTMSLREDSTWSLGVGFEWQWTENRTPGASLSYIGVDDAPVTTPAIGGLGGEYTSRDIVQLERSAGNRRHVRQKWSLICRD